MVIELTTITKIVSFICGVVIIIMSISRFTSLDVTSPRPFILTVHFMFDIKKKFHRKIYNDRLLGSILILSEFKIDYVQRNFGLIKNLRGRGAYSFL